MDFLIARLKEPSTWRGIVAIAAILGVNISPEMQQGIIGVAVALLGVIEIFRAEKKVRG